MRATHTPPSAASVTPNVRRSGLLLLTALGVLTEAVLLLGWVWPLSLWRTPTNLPAGAPMALIFGQTFSGGLRFAVPSLALVGLWASALVAARRPIAHGVPVVVAFAALFSVTLLAINPGGTQDIYHNIADGRIVWRYGDNPTLVPPIAYPDDPFMPNVWGYADLPSAYGPLWYLALGVPYLVAGDGLVANVLAQKALAGEFMLGTLLLTLACVRVVAPSRALLATALLGWCPLLLWEFAGNGHNDSMMAFFVAAAFLAAVRRRYLWLLPLLTLSALVKFTTALLVPVALVWLLRRDDVPRRVVLWGIASSAAITAIAFAPMWAGVDTVAALRRPGMTFILSPATLLHGALSGVVSETDASRLTRLITGGAFLAWYAVTVWRTRGDVRDLADRGFDALFAYLLLASWWFWPWYILWLAPLAALGRGWQRLAAFALMTSAALLTYLYWWTDPDPPWRSQAWFLSYAVIAVGVFAVPFGVWAAHRLPSPPAPLPTRRERRA